MNPPSEIDVMKLIDTQLSSLNDPVVRDRILRWAIEKFGTQVATGSLGAKHLKHEEPATPEVHSKKPVVRKKSGKGTGKAKTSLSIVKDLNLKPSGKKSFGDFIKEKQPSSNTTKCTVAVYYLKNEIGVEKVNASHVFTCFKIVGWRVPSDLVNALQYTASRNGWLDTSDMSDLKVTTHGDNLVEHDLPPRAATPGK